MNDNHPTPQDDKRDDKSGPVDIDIDGLSAMVQMEANRVLSETQLEPDPALVAEGWERRFMGDAVRIKDAVELYTELGFEVLTVPMQPEELSDDCSGCRLVVMLQFQTLYTRRKGAADDPELTEHNA